MKRKNQCSSLLRRSKSVDVFRALAAQYRADGVPAEATLSQKTSLFGPLGSVLRKRLEFSRPSGMSASQFAVFQGLTQICCGLGRQAVRIEFLCDAQIAVTLLPSMNERLGKTLTAEQTRLLQTGEQGINLFGLLAIAQQLAPQFQRAVLPLREIAHGPRTQRRLGARQAHGAGLRGCE